MKIKHKRRNQRRLKVNRRCSRFVYSRCKDIVVYSNIMMNFARDLLVFKKFELTEVIQKVVIHPYKQILR